MDTSFILFNYYNEIVLIYHSQPTPQNCTQLVISLLDTFACRPESVLTGIAFTFLSDVELPDCERVQKNLSLMIWIIDSSPPLFPLKASISSLALQLIVLNPLGKHVWTTVFAILGTFCTIWDTTLPTIPGINSYIFCPIIGKNWTMALLAFSFMEGRRNLRSFNKKGYYCYNCYVLDCSLLEGEEFLIGLGMIAIQPLSLTPISMKTESSCAELSSEKLELVYLWKT